MHTKHNTCPSVSGNLEAIEQGLALLHALNDQNYTYSAPPYVESGTGEHLRHIVDMYQALMNEPRVGVVDYDCRRRGAPVERERAAGINALHTIRQWLLSLDPDQLETPVTILSEASVTSRQICEMRSTLRRELLFVASHTIHHFALIRVVTLYLDVKTDDEFGYAPATASYLRQQN